MKSGDLILVKFPFTDLESSKKRPALLLSQTHVTSKVGLLTIAMVTSKIEGLRLAGDLRIEKWKEAGLLHESLVRLSKIATVEQDLAIRPLGRLGSGDLESIRAAFRKHFRFWIN